MASMPIAAWMRSRDNGGPYQGIAGFLEDAVLVDVSDVARFYYESPQEIWTIGEDFPNVAPPWETAWYEWVVPARINSEGIVSSHPLVGWRYGALVIGEDVEKVGRRVFEDLDTPDARDAVIALLVQSAAARWLVKEQRPELIRDLYTPSPAELRAELGEELWQRAADRLTADGVETFLAEVAEYRWRWLMEIHLFCWSPHLAEPLLISSLKLPVDEEGGFIAGKPEDGFTPYANGQPRWLILGSLSAGVEPDPGKRELDRNHLALYNVPFLALSFAHCRNVQLVDTQEDRAARRRALRAGRPCVTFKTLEIQPMRTVLTAAAARQTTPTNPASPRALHICRGHFSDYRDGRGLFGKHHGLFWQPMHTRGSLPGHVHKDYRVAAP